MLAKETDSLTDFRDGRINLHYLHVNKAKRGRSCRACHDTHASTNPMHVRESVPFGKWQMPISFTPTKTGGTCMAGCHKKLSYDRTILPMPTTAPSSGGKVEKEKNADKTPEKKSQAKE